MVVTIHQPDFIPWLGFFHRWAKSDLFIILDDVQFLRRGWHHRDRIKTLNGTLWLTVPVKKKGRYSQQIKDVEIDNTRRWREKHLLTIRNAYIKAPNFQRCFELFQKIYNKKHSHIIGLNVDILMFMAAEFGINTPVVYSSVYKIKESSSEKLAMLVNSVNGDVYLTGTGSRDYLDVQVFNSLGIKVQWQEYEHPVYRQLHGRFIPMLSAIDYLMMTSSPDIFHEKQRLFP